MKKIKSLLCLAILLSFIPATKADHTVDLLIHQVVEKNISHLQKLNADGFEVFKKDLLNVLENSNHEHTVAYKNVINALKNLTKNDLKNIKKALEQLQTLLDNLPEKTSTYIRKNLPKMVTALLQAIKK